jgi:hypothetical protein
VICELYDHQSSLSELAELIIQRQRHILDRFVHLFYRGYVQPVLEKIKLMYSSGLMDSSLIRFNF